VAVSTSIVRRLHEAAECLDEYGRMQPRIARCVAHPPGWKPDPDGARRLAEDLRGLARSYAAREERAGLAGGGAT